MQILGFSACSLPLGNAVRHCSGEKGWLPPELFNCTTASFVELRALVSRRPGVGCGAAGPHPHPRPGACGRVWPSCPGSSGPASAGRVPSPRLSSGHRAPTSSTGCLFPSALVPDRPSIFTSVLSAEVLFGVFQVYFLTSFCRQIVGFGLAGGTYSEHSRFADTTFLP